MYLPFYNCSFCNDSVWEKCREHRALLQPNGCSACLVTARPLLWLQVRTFVVPFLSILPCFLSASPQVFVNKGKNAKKKKKILQPSYHNKKYLCVLWWEIFKESSYRVAVSCGTRPKAGSLTSPMVSLSSVSSLTG